MNPNFENSPNILIISLITTDLDLNYLHGMPLKSHNEQAPGHLRKLINEFFNKKSLIISKNKKRTDK